MDDKPQGRIGTPALLWQIQATEQHSEFLEAGHSNFAPTHAISVTNIMELAAGLFLMSATAVGTMTPYCNQRYYCRVWHNETGPSLDEVGLLHTEDGLRRAITALAFGQSYGGNWVMTV
jgi:hypothetical protein